MGVKYIADLMPVSKQEAYRRHFPNGEEAPGPTLPPSGRVFLQNGTIPFASLESFRDLESHRALMTKEEKELCRVISGIKNYEDFELLEWFRDIVLQRYIRRSAAFLQERLVFPYGLEVVEFLLRRVFPEIEVGLTETEPVNTRAWWDWYYTADVKAWRLIEPKLQSTKPTTLKQMLATIESEVNLTMRRFVLGSGTTTKKWAGVWNLFLNHGLVSTSSERRFWDDFAFHFQVMAGGQPQTARPGSMQVLASSYLNPKPNHSPGENTRKREVARLREIVIESLSRRPLIATPRVKTSTRTLPLIEELYYYVLRLELDRDFSPEFYQQLTTYIFGSEEDFAGYAKWKAAVERGEIPRNHAFTRIFN